ncbi:MAG: hypothetical protein ACRDDI_13595 [Aeromonas veronii]
MSTIQVMCRETGVMLTALDSLRQRLGDCLSFPKGSLVAGRDYGADLLELLDRNMTPSFSMDAFVIITAALNDPISGLSDFKLDSMGITDIGPHHIEIVVTGTWLPNNEPVTLEGVRVGGR